MIIAMSRSVKQIFCYWPISSEQDAKQYFEKVEGLTSPIYYDTLKGAQSERMEYFQNPQGACSNSQRRVCFIVDMIREENPLHHYLECAYTRAIS
jgi:hypothetical protein